MLWTTAIMLGCVGHTLLHTFLTRHKQMVLEKCMCCPHSSWEEQNTGLKTTAVPCSSQARSLCTLSQYKQQRFHTSKFLREHKAVITFRLMRLRPLYVTLLKGNPMHPHLVCNFLTLRTINHIKKNKSKEKNTLCSICTLESV